MTKALVRISVLTATLMLGLSATCRAYGESNPETSLAAVGDPDQTSRTGGPYDYFLFVRHDREDDAGPTDTLVMARVTPGDFELRDVYTRNNLDTGLEPLCVAGGKAYFLKITDLLSIDLETGECSQIASGLTDHGYDSGKFYRVASRQDDRSIGVYDFHKRAYRDLVPIPWPADSPLAISPDHRRIAYLDSVRSPDTPTNSFQLVVVDLETKAVETPCGVIEFATFIGSSNPLEVPPHAWLDADRILLVRTHTAEGEGYNPERFVNWLAVANVVTGELTDVIPLPGSALDSSVHILPWSTRSEIYLQQGYGPYGRYRVDLENARLVEDETVGGDYRVSRQGGIHYLHHGTKVLAESQTTPMASSVSVSPDGRRILWRRGGRARGVNYYDADEEAIRTVTYDWCGRAYLWFTEEDLQEPSQPPEIPAGWTAFEETAWPRARPPDKRKSIKELVTFTISCDKERYPLHEPVELTFTVTNNSDVDFEIVRPAMGNDSLELGIHYGSGSRLFGYSWGTEEINPVETMVLKAGETVRVAQTIEVPREGSYSIDGRFAGVRSALDPQLEWRGSLRVEPVSFEVVSSPDADRFLERKVERMVKTLRDEYDRDPRWDGWSPTVRGLEEIGKAAAPYLIAAIREEDKPPLVERLCRPLVTVASPDALPLYSELVGSDHADLQKRVCYGLVELYHQNTRVKDEALDELVSSLDGIHARVRLDVVRRTAQLYDSRVRDSFPALLEDREPRVRRTAAWYVAAYEGLDLDEWLARAAEQPSLTDCAVAHVIVNDLESSWHMNKGDLPAARWSKISTNPTMLAQYRKTLLAWAEWARENPRASSGLFEKVRSSWPKPLPSPDDPEEVRLERQARDDGLKRIRLGLKNMRERKRRALRADEASTPLSPETSAPRSVGGMRKVETQPAEPKQGAEITARPLTGAERKLIEQVTALANLADTRFWQEEKDDVIGASLWHVRAGNDATVWDVVHLRCESEPGIVEWQSRKLIDTQAEYYRLPDARPLKSRWEPAGNGVYRIRMHIGGYVKVGEGVGFVSRHPTDPGQFKAVPNSEERRFEFRARSNDPRAWIVRLDDPLEAKSWFPDTSDVRHEDGYTELTWLLPPDPDNALGYVNFNVPGDTVKTEQDTVPRERTIRFPEGRSLGGLSVRSWGSSYQWEKLGKAMGNVRIPPGKEVRLRVSNQGATALSPLATLAPDDIQGIWFPWLFSRRRADRLHEEMWPEQYVQTIPVPALDASEELVLDGELAHIKGLTGLKMLDLGGLPITDAGLAHLSRLTSLEELKFGQTPRAFTQEGPWWRVEHSEITDSGLTHLNGLTSLRDLDLAGTSIRGPGLANLKRMGSLERLHLERTDVTDAGLEHVKVLASLQYLNLEDTRVTRAGVKGVLRALPDCEIKDTVGGTWPDVPGSRTLHFPEDRSVGAVYVRESGMKGIGDWEQPAYAVGNVEIPGGQEVRLAVSNEAAKDLSPLDALRPDDIQELVMDVSSRSMRQPEWRLGVLPVSPFELSEGLVLDDELAHIKNLTGLERLSLVCFPVTDAGLGHLSGLTSLEELRFGKEANVLYMNGGWLIYENRKITDSGLVHLKDLTSLHTLDLTGTNVEGPGLAHLKGLTSLRNLYLTRTKVDAAGLEYLKALTSLRHLDLRDTQVTGVGIEHPGVEELRKALPACRIRAGGVIPLG